MNIKKQDVWKALGGAAIVTLLLFLCGLAAAAPARALFGRGGYSEESFDEISERLRAQVYRDARAALAAAGAIR